MHNTTWLLGLVASAALIAGCGDGSDRGGAMAGMDHGNVASTGPALDRGFAQAMIPHNESAVEMALLAQQRGESKFVTQLAEAIISTQTAEIVALEGANRRLAEAGADVGAMGMSEAEMSMDMDMEALRAAAAFDPTFLEMMIEHHRAAIEMADIELLKGSDAELQGIASEIVDAQETEIARMRARLSSGVLAGRMSRPAYEDAALEHRR